MSSVPKWGDVGKWGEAIGNIVPSDLPIAPVPTKVAAEEQFEITAIGFPPDLLTMGVRVIGAHGAIVMPRQTAGIQQSTSGSGTYVYQLVAPSLPGQYLIVWDTGQLTPKNVAIEALDVNYDITAGESFTAFVDWETEASLGALIAVGRRMLTERIANAIEIVPGAGVYALDLVAPSEGGSYVVLWDDGDRLAAARIEVFKGWVWQPTVSDVAALLRARTKQIGTAQELGTFTAETRPTGQQVQTLIRKATGDLAMVIGDEVPGVIMREANETAALKAAMMVELSYFPEQVATNRSPYAQYKELYDDAVGSPQSPGKLVIAVQEAVDGTVSVHRAIPSSNFTGVKKYRW